MRLTRRGWAKWMGLMAVLLASGGWDENSEPPLWVAAARGDVAAAKALIEDGHSVSERGIWSYTPLMAAVKYQHLEVARLLLDSGADPDEHAGHDSALSEAVGRDDPRLALLLLDRGASNVELDEPLDDALTKGHADVAARLVELGAALHDKEGPLEYAIEGGFTDCVRIALEKGAKLAVENIDRKLAGAVDDGYAEIAMLIVRYRRQWLALESQAAHAQEDALLRAAYEGNDEAVGEILGADDSLDPLVLQTAYRFSMQQGQIRASRLLRATAKQAKDSLEDGAWRTRELPEAVARGDLAVVKALLASGVEPGNALDRVKGEHAGEIARLLLEHGGTVSYVSGSAARHEAEVFIQILQQVECSEEELCLALISAAGAGRLDNVKLLLERGIGVNAPMSTGSTALMAAAEKGHADVVRYLLARGADVNTADHDGFTALEKAEGYLRGEVATILRDAGAQPVTRRRLNPLVGAIHRWSSVDRIQQLLDAGADPNLFDANALDTPLARLIKSGVGESSTTLQVLRMLLSAGADPAQNPGLLVHLAASSCFNDWDRAEAARLLIQTGFPVEDGGYDTNSTPLIVAAQFRRIAMLKLLIESGADIDARRSDGRRAMEVVKAREQLTQGDREVIDILEQAEKLAAMREQAGHVEATRSRDSVSK
jgi:ankyrin repeat protein